MSKTNKAFPQWFRLCLIVGLSALFVGSAVYSMRAVGYSVGGKPTGELEVTRLSLTHEVERGADGRLTNPYADAEASRPVSYASSPKSEAPVKMAKAATTSKPAAATVKKATKAKKSSVAKPVVKKKPSVIKPATKPVVKKPVVKKATPTPAPAKPAPKKKPRACPT